MNVKTYVTSSEEETIQAGRAFATLLDRPAVVLLIGNLGAGKTTFTKGVAEALAGTAPDDVTSPTFTLIHEYAAGIWHLDLYRIETDGELSTLGIEDLTSDPEGILIVEWGERFRRVFPPSAWLVTLERQPDGSRLISVERASPAGG